MKTPDKTANKDQNEHRPLNIAFGVRNERGTLIMIGNAPVKVRLDKSRGKLSTITVGNKTYELTTTGLNELLFNNKPNGDVINEKDKLVYKDILILTNAHKRGFISSGQIQGIQE